MPAATGDRRFREAASGRGFSFRLNLEHVGSARLKLPQNIIVAGLRASAPAALSFSLDEGEPIRVRRGETHWLPSGRSIQLRWQGARFALLHLHPSRLVPAECQPQPGRLPPAHRVFRDSLLESLIDLLATPERPESNVCTPVYSDSIVNVLAVRLTELVIHGQAASPRAQPGASGAIGELVSFIDDHLDEDLSLKRLAAIAGLSPHRVSRLFRQALGMPPHRFVLERRIQQARGLLVATNDSIADIAYQVGFSSHAHLTTMFRRRIGMTPSTYRRQQLCEAGSGSIFHTQPQGVAS